MTDDKSNILRGIGAAPGLAIAKAYLFKKERESINQGYIEDIDDAIKSLDEALDRSRKELGKIFSLAIDKLGEKRASIFEAQIMILDDPVLIENIKKRINDEKRYPEYIVDDEISKYQKLMDEVNESYMKERSLDIADIKNRIIRNLKQKKWKSRITQEVIVVTDNLTPADSVLFTRANARGYVTNFGGLTSHAAIIARSLNVPAVVGVHEATVKINDGETIIIDGFKGIVVVNPTEEQLAKYEERVQKLHIYDKELALLKDQPAVTSDGKKIALLSNLDLFEEMDMIVQNGADGVGLVRTEQVFEEYAQFPSEEEQYKFYSEIAKKIYPNNAIIRALDIGGDKVLPFDVKEANPFLGWRGIRFLLDNRPLFKTQIRAVLRASTNRNIKFMLPMIASIVEIRQSRKLIEECKKELDAERIHYDSDMQVGIMIEVPSAAVMANEFAAEADFMSIGTNDLIQYLLAVDRGNEIVSGLYQEFHPAVIRSLEHIIREGKIKDKFVSICGEMASDPIAIPLLVGLGLDSLSLSPAQLPVTKRIIRSISYKEVKNLADECLKLETECEIKDKLNHFFNEKIEEQIRTSYL